MEIVKSKFKFYVLSWKRNGLWIRIEIVKSNCMCFVFSFWFSLLALREGSYTVVMLSLCLVILFYL